MTDYRELFALADRATIARRFADAEKVTLTEGEQATARIMASFRAGLNRANGVRDRKKSPRNGYDLDLDGIGGEMAYGKMTNLFMDVDVFPRRGGHDFITRAGRTVDVKTTPNPNGDLLVAPRKKGDPSDYYVLMIGDFPTYYCAGWAKKDEVFLDSNLTDLTHGATYLVPRSELKNGELEE